MNSQTLNKLYPFLNDKKIDTNEQQQQALYRSIQAKVTDSIETKQNFFAKNSEQMILIAQALAGVYAAGGRMFTMGNGGSSCDANHLAVEFQHPVTTGRPSLPAMNLCSDTAMTSAVGNDIGFSQIFARQVEAHGRAGDALVGFSTSGNSDNLMSAFRKARQMKLLTIGFAGGSGGQMQESGLLDHCLIVETDSIHRVQESHVMTYHVLWDLVHSIFSYHRSVQTPTK